MRKKSSARIVRKNQRLRKRASKAIKTQPKSFIRMKLSGKLDIPETIRLYTKNLHPNQAQPC